MPTLAEWQAQQAAAERANQAKYLEALNSGGWEGFFAGQTGRPAGDIYSTGGFLPVSGAAQYQWTPEQARTVSGLQPIRVGETNQLVYKGQIYDNPIGFDALYGGYSPAVRQQISQQLLGAGVGGALDQRVAGYTPAQLANVSANYGGGLLAGNVGGSGGGKRKRDEVTSAGPGPGASREGFEANPAGVVNRLGVPQPGLPIQAPTSNLGLSSSQLQALLAINGQRQPGNVPANPSMGLFDYGTRPGWAVGGSTVRRL